MLCACTEPFFGEYCDKVCNQGQVLKGVDGRSYCSCLPFYQGERCTEMICMNGGIEIHGRCTCPQSFTGYHCEIDANLTVQHGSRFHRFDESNELFSRDISGTAFSLVMIIVLVVSMYLLMKHRMQVQSRFTASRREEMTRAAALYSITSRRGDVVSPEDLRIVPFVAAGIDRPPPYVLHTYAVRDEILPPLPSYEDATKTTPIRITQADEFSNSNDATMINVQLDSSVDRDSNRSSTSGVTESRPQIENNNQRETPIISRLVISRKSF
ncbi:hypothetical protein DICVIV_00053 [Dictyocaulus viviparus]|uniref:EGF-like domain-containing protein n=1 Tax=Dictyocaulus viviparus TaxID=29172 RepID=A0A0D8YA37_DICVI|nr:hypothetical protein DICVIV_00053 [Dictyocaulus viviparus]